MHIDEKVCSPSRYPKSLHFLYTQLILKQSINRNQLLLTFYFYVTKNSWISVCPELIVKSRVTVFTSLFKEHTKQN